MPPGRGYRPDITQQNWQNMPDSWATELFRDYNRQNAARGVTHGPPMDQWRSKQEGNYNRPDWQIDQMMRGGQMTPDQFSRTKSAQRRDPRNAQPDAFMQGKQGYRDQLDASARTPEGRAKLEQLKSQGLGGSRLNDAFAQQMGFQGGADGSHLGRAGPQTGGMGYIPGPTSGPPAGWRPMEEAYGGNTVGAPGGTNPPAPSPGAPPPGAPTPGAPPPPNAPPPGAPGPTPNPRMRAGDPRAKGGATLEERKSLKAPSRQSRLDYHKQRTGRMHTNDPNNPNYQPTSQEKREQNQQSAGWGQGPSAITDWGGIQADPGHHQEFNTSLAKAQAGEAIPQEHADYWAWQQHAKQNAGENYDSRQVQDFYNAAGNQGNAPWRPGAGFLSGEQYTPSGPSAPPPGGGGVNPPPGGGGGTNPPDGGGGPFNPPDIGNPFPNGPFGGGGFGGGQNPFQASAQLGGVMPTAAGAWGGQPAWGQGMTPQTMQQYAGGGGQGPTPQWMQQPQMNTMQNDYARGGSLGMDRIGQLQAMGHQIGRAGRGGPFGSWGGGMGQADPWAANFGNIVDTGPTGTGGGMGQADPTAIHRGNHWSSQTDPNPQMRPMGNFLSQENMQSFNDVQNRLSAIGGRRQLNPQELGMMGQFAQANGIGQGNFDRGRGMPSLYGGWN